MLHLIFWGEGEARATFRDRLAYGHSPWHSTFRSISLDFHEFQPVVDSKIEYFRIFWNILEYSGVFSNIFESDHMTSDSN